MSGIAPFRRGGVIEGAFVVVRDVTARELAHADAVAASDGKSACLANMSHEIRTPLDGVISTAAPASGSRSRVSSSS